MKKIGITLSGGGVKAIIYAGALQALEDSGLPIEVVGGISGGAIVGSLFCAGYSGKEILEIAKKTNFLKFTTLTSIRQGEVLDHKVFEDLLSEYLKVKTFEELKRKFVIFASDLDNKTQVVIDSGDLTSAIVASSAIPPIFKPVMRNNLRLVDGGFSTTYGKSFIKNKGANYVIGLSVEKWIDVSAFPGLVKDFTDALGIAWLTIAAYEQKYDPVDYSIREFSDSTNMLDFRTDFDSLFEKGYKVTMDQVESIKQDIHKRKSLWDFIFR